MKGLFIPGITAEMFRNGWLESIEALMAEGEIYDIEHPTWIPTHERLPEKNGNYLVTYESSDGTTMIRYEAVDHYGPNWLHETRHKKVVAWMPSPGPYKSESEK